MSGLLSEYLRVSLDNGFANDWERQRVTADDILRRLQKQEGVVLADQVGMGKTFVALAVAVSQILRKPELDQVVVFAPARVAEKWVNEWGKFRESLLVGAPDIRCVRHAIRSGEDFLKLLDNRPKDRTHLVVVTHEALTASLKDSFIQLALLYYAVRNRNEAAEMRKRIAKWSGWEKGLFRDRRFTTERVSQLLSTPPDRWRSAWLKLAGEDLGDDPVPDHLHEVSHLLGLDSLWGVIRNLPANKSSGLEEHLKKAREKLNDTTQAVWKQVLVLVKPRLPLLIIDEAHALKNDHTRISRLFTPLPHEPEDGALNGIFERILLLTATPFELGHNELIRVLSRLKAIRHMRLGATPSLDSRLDKLKDALHKAQESAIMLNEAWLHVYSEDLPAFIDWLPDSEPGDEMSVAARRAWRYATLAVRARKVLHAELRDWVIRHERPRRRRYLPGAAIRPGDEAKKGFGLEIPEDVSLPFLLAARAQAVAVDDGSATSRPLFAYGIASSYEAFLRLEANEDVLDSDAEPIEGSDSKSHELSGTAAQWYQREIKRQLRSGDQRKQHPKIAATVDRAIHLWLSGQKCLIFCWYIRTTMALRDALQARLGQIVQARVADSLGVSVESADSDLENLSNRLLRRGSENYEMVFGRIRSRFAEAAAGNDVLAEEITRIAIRNLRTPAYLLRYTNLQINMDAEGLLSGIAGVNPSGIDLLARWCGFVSRMSAMTNDERTRILANLLGEHHFADEDHASGGSRAASLAQIRHAYGGTNREDRERLISVFNTPFAPDILVASSVMGEGIDLHQECCHVIHHDLDWNPSKLEQRTGRLDRIGALAERIGVDIEVFEPYLAGTHDEKMFRVVKDRAGWFDIVMGSAMQNGEKATDKDESRVPLPEAIREALTMNLQACSYSE